MDFKRRIANTIVAYTYDRQPVTCHDLRVEDAVTILMKDAVKPNLVQTLEGTPAIIHGGPFANIAHGCNSIIATKTAMTLADYVITEAGFGADLGAEKFLDIKCRKAGIKPKCVVLVATVRALKFNGGVAKDDITKVNMGALARGTANLIAHIEMLNRVFNASVVVALNEFVTDTDEEIAFVRQVCAENEARFVRCEAWAKGGEGARELAEAVVDVVENGSKEITFAYKDTDDIVDKIRAVATKVYGASDIKLSKKAESSIATIKRLGYSDLPICIAKTQYSLSDDAKLLGRPQGFTLSVEDVELRSGAEFIVVIAGNIMLMPGLSKEPAAVNMTIDENNNIRGLF